MTTALGLLPPMLDLLRDERRAMAPFKIRDKPLNSNARKQRRLQTALGICLFLCAASSHAQFAATEDVPDIFTFYGTSNTSYDTNLFRLAETKDTEATLGKKDRSDLVELIGVGVQLDKRYSQQQITGDASIARYLYNNFSYLDASTTNYNLAWKWHLTPRFSGTISGNRKQLPADYDFYRNVKRSNYYNQQEYRARFDANPIGGWHVIGGGGVYLFSNSTANSDTPRSKQTFADGGFSYVTQAGSRIQAIARYSDGQYSQNNTAEFAENRDFEEKSTEVQFTSKPLEIVMIQLVGGYVSRKHKELSDRNFDGWTIDSSVTWRVVDKVTLTGRARRTISAYQDPYFSSYSREDYTFSPDWKLTSKISLSGSIGYSRYKFEGTPEGVQPVDRKDLLGTYSAAISWIPSQYVAFKLSNSNRVRDSSFDLENLDYVSNLTSLSATLSY